MSRTLVITSISSPLIPSKIKKEILCFSARLIVCVFMVLFVVNVKFLGPYYIQNKETEFVEMYERLDDALITGTIKQTDTMTGLQNLAEKHNISFLILEGISGEDIDVITNVRDMNLLKNHSLRSEEHTSELQSPS